MQLAVILLFFSLARFTRRVRKLATWHSEWVVYSETQQAKIALAAT